MESSYATTSSGIGLWVREARFRRRMLAAHQKFDAFVLSVPKAGRTWHRLMFGYYLTRLTGCDPKESFDLDKLCALAGTRRVGYTHNASQYAYRLPLSSSLIASPIEWSGRHVLLLVRDPSDTLVSAYHHARFRQRRFEGSLSDFVRGENTGIEKLLITHNRWNENLHLAASADIMSYEQMSRDPGEILRRGLQFAGLKSFDSALIKASVEFSSVDNMRRLEAQGYFSTRLVRRDVSDAGLKVRQGQSGSGKGISDDDKAFIAGAVERLGNPFAQYCE